MLAKAIAFNTMRTAFVVPDTGCGDIGSPAPSRLDTLRRWWTQKSDSTAPRAEWDRLSLTAPHLQGDTGLPDERQAPLRRLQLRGRLDDGQAEAGLQNGFAAAAE